MFNDWAKPWTFYKAGRTSSVDFVLDERRIWFEEAVRRVLAASTEPTSADAPRKSAPMLLVPDAVDRALRAHWPTFDRMRPDIAHKWRGKMEAALRAGLPGLRNELLQLAKKYAGTQFDNDPTDQAVDARYNNAHAALAKSEGEA